jgi:hypothetical protein
MLYFVHLESLDGLTLVLKMNFGRYPPEKVERLLYEPVSLNYPPKELPESFVTKTRTYQWIKQFGRNVYYREVWQK